MVLFDHSLTTIMTSRQSARKPRAMTDNKYGKAVPSSRLRRLGHFGGLAAGIAGNVVAGGVRELASGRRPRVADLMLTPANARKMTDKLAQMRGAAMKLGQLLSMDSGDFVPPELADILARLRADAEPMTDAQLARILVGQWGDDWRQKLSAFDARPIAAASIGQVHRARSVDGRDLAVKIQYPDIADSIDSDVENASMLLKASGLLPRHIDIAPLLAEAKMQLHDEADYIREARYLTRYAKALAGDTRFSVPQVLPDLSTPRILAMTYAPGISLEQLTSRPQAERDRVAGALMDLVLSELFALGVMQSDPNLANYRYDTETGTIVLLDFGAARDVSPDIERFYRQMLSAGLAGDRDVLRSALEDFGLIDSRMNTAHVASVLQLFDMILEPMLHQGPFDFGNNALMRSIRDQGLGLLNDKSNWRLPPAELFFVQRKLGGMYHLAARLRARVDIGALLRVHLHRTPGQ
jgi:predicted unusual protein kinase regulating ubiquinone biosynthesis (AarF/ABC1/UbiB family)